MKSKKKSWLKVYEKFNVYENVLIFFIIAHLQTDLLMLRTTRI